jgi:hypothetical protein
MPKQEKKRNYLDDLDKYLFADDVENRDFIYFIVCHVGKNEKSNRVKIGRSKNPEKRLNSLQGGNPFNLVLWYKFPVPSSEALALEKSLHQKFRWSKQKLKYPQRKKRHDFEWFVIHPCIKEFVKMHRRERRRIFNLKYSDDTDIAIAKNSATRINQ